MSCIDTIGKISSSSTQIYLDLYPTENIAAMGIPEGNAFLTTVLIMAIGQENNNNYCNNCYMFAEDS